MTQQITSDRESSGNAEHFADVLAERAVTYFQDLHGGDTAVQLVSARIRPYSELYEYCLSNAESRHVVFVKLPHLDEALVESACNRPRLFPAVVPSQMGMLEHRALTALDRHFSTMSPRFGSVRVLDLLVESDALVIAKAEGDVLRSVMRKANARSAEVERGFLNAGAWLRELHSIAGLEHTQDRSERRDSFVESLGQFADYLGRNGGPHWLKGVVERLAAQATNELPEAFPLGLAHGDFAPRNILMSDGGRVTVLDTLARWRAPIYEDIALFLLSLRLSTQVTRIGTLRSPAVLQNWTNAFLRGYFEEGEIPWREVRLFECQAILDRWCSYASRPAHFVRPTEFKQACRYFAFRRLAKRTLFAALDDA